MKILSIASFKENELNGIKSVLEKIVPNYIKIGIEIEVYNIKISEEKIDYSKYDLVLFHGVYFLKYLIISEKFRKLKIPYVIIPHCSLTKISLKQSRLKKILFNMVAKNFYKNALSIGYLNEEEKENSSIKNSKNIYLPNGIEEIMTLNKMDTKEIKLMFLSRIDIYHKGLDLLLESINLIKDKLREKNILLNIYGDGKDKDKDIFFNKIEEYKLNDIIFYKGRVDGQEKIKAFQENQIFILTSRFEGFPISVLEALSFGLPCILTEGTNMKSIIKKYNSGWISKTNIEDISLKILDALEAYEIKKEIYINNSIKNAEDYKWEKVVIKHKQEFNKILNLVKK